MLKSWISCSCGYKFPQTWWPKTRKPYSFTVLEAGSLKFRSEQSCVPSEGSEEDCLRVSSNFWWWLSCSVVSNSLWPHGLQHTRIPCSLPSPGVCSNSCPLSQWCHSTISSSVVPFSSRLQSFPVSGSFPVSWLFVSGSQSIRVSASASVLPMNIQDWFPLGLIDLISVQSQGLSRVFASTTVQMHHFFCTQPSLWPFCYKPPEKLQP